MANYYLEPIDNRLALHVNGEENFKPLYIDFAEGKENHRRLFRGKELVAKAVGYKKSQSLTVIDATAGLGRDAFVLASLGCQVRLIERSPTLAALLKDGLLRAAQDPQLADIAARMTFIHDNAVTLLPSLTADVVYLDPMYPHRTKSALVKKEMRILRDVVGDDADADKLLAIALQCATKRVVVKRPRLAETLNAVKPDIVYAGKNSRFDVYLTKPTL
jgi:16S rRNA (guanine1516-N2)-methyltransferase